MLKIDLKRFFKKPNLLYSSNKSCNFFYYNFDIACLEFFLNKLPVTDNSYLNNIRDMKVSSHLYIKRSGEIIQFVPFDKRAWHAGQSSFENIKNCNDYSIGIELEGCEDIVYENIQYIKLSEIINSLLGSYKHLSLNRIVSHSDIAPGRKSDPGPLFDWKRLKTMIK